MPQAGHQRTDVGRALLQPDQPAVRPVPSGRIGVNQVGRSGEFRDERFRRRADYLDIARFEPLEIVPGDERQYRIALQRDDAPESSGQHQRVDAQAAGPIDAQSASNASGGMMQRAR